MFESARYTTSIRRLHWLMAIMIGLAYLVIEQRGLFERGSSGRFAMMQTHFWLGLSIFFLVWFRITQRLKYGAPRITPGLTRTQAGISHLFHFALYAFFIVMPILGLLTAWFDDKTLFIPFTQIAIPSLVTPDKDIAHQLEDLHGQIGDIFYWVIGIHILAALYHHFVRKDDTLKRMT